MNFVNGMYYMQGHDAKIVINLNKKEYFPGETIIGNINLCVLKPIAFFDIIMRLDLMRLWGFENVQSNVKIYEQRLNLPLLINQNNLSQIQLGPSNNYYPFTMKLEKHLSPTLELRENSRVIALRYTFSATVLTSMIQLNTQESICILMKSLPKPLGNPLNQSSIVNVQLWGIKDQGTTILAVSYPKNNYSYLDTVPLSLVVNNKRSNLDVCYLKIELHRQVIINNDYNEKVDEYDTILYLYKLGIDCRSGQVKGEKFYLKIVDDISIASDWELYPGQTDKGNFIGSVNHPGTQCSYYIKVTGYYTWFVPFNSRPRVILPLSITSQVNDYDNIQYNNGNMEVIANDNGNANANVDANAQLKEKSDMEEAIKQSKIEYEKMNENKLINDIEEEEYLKKQIEHIEVENKKQVFNPFVNSFEHERCIHSYIQNKVPLIVEDFDVKQYQHNENHNFEYKNGNSNSVIYEDNNTHNSYYGKDENMLQNKLNISNQKVFEHNMSIFVMDKGFEEKLKPQENKKKGNGVIDINAL